MSEFPRQVMIAGEWRTVVSEDEMRFENDLDCLMNLTGMTRTEAIRAVDAKRRTMLGTITCSCGNRECHPVRQRPTVVGAASVLLFEAEHRARYG